MKRVILILTLLTSLYPLKAGAKTEELDRVRCTVYLPTGNKTASGTVPREGIIAANKERIGQLAALYTEDMEFIGYFECKDTGGHKDIKKGTRIDVFRASEKNYKQWVKEYGDYVYIQWIESEG